MIVSCASYGERKQRAQNMSVTGGHIVGSSSRVSESSSAEKSIAGLLSNADEQLRTAREYITTEWLRKCTDTIYTHTEKACRHNSLQTAVPA